MISENSLILYQHPSNDNISVIKLYSNLIFEILGCTTKYNLLLFINNSNNIMMLTILPTSMHNINIKCESMSCLELINILKMKTYIISYTIIFKSWKDICMQLCENKLDELLEIEAYKRGRQHAAKLISNILYDAWNNPYTPIGRQRILREYEMLMLE